MPIVAVQQLHKRYGQNIAVDDVSFSIEQGEIFGIIGPNGAGKTTTVECIGGLRRPDGGTVRVLGHEPSQNCDLLRQRVGIQLQQCRLPAKLKVWEALDLYASFYERPANCDQLIDDLGLTKQRNTLYHKLSGGQQQRVSIALALVGNPQFAILDELTTGLDPQARRETWDLIKQLRERGLTILVVTHAMEEVEYICDRVAIIDKGRVVALDTPSGLASRTQAPQTLRFRPSVPIEDQVLRAIPEVLSVRNTAGIVEIIGTGNIIGAVLGKLAQHQVVATELRIDQPTLDDAFITLVNRK